VSPARPRAMSPGAAEAASSWDPAVEIRVEVRPPWPFVLPGGSLDGLTRRRGRALQRLLRLDGEPVLVGIVQPAPDRVLFAARSRSEAAAREGIARMRFATDVDDDLRPFYDRFRGDPVIGAAVRMHRTVRIRRKPDPWEALMAAITEQLIELERAIEIQRRIIAALGYRCPATRMRAAPAPTAVACEAPARLVSFDLAPKRALAMRRCADGVARGRIDLRSHDMRRLLAIPEIGRWTVEMLALHGQGRMDVVPAGDLGFLKLVGRLMTGNPRARADEAEVRGFFARYGDWKGLAGAYLHLAATTGLSQDPPILAAPRRRGSPPDADRPRSKGVHPEDARPIDPAGAHGAEASTMIGGSGLIPDRTRPGPIPRREGTRWSAAPAGPAAA
jgi:DNA-3-methyladenine glycosylase II